MFGYPTNSSPRKSLLFAFSIKDTLDILTQSINTQSYNPILEYFEQDITNSLVVKFLNNTLDLAHSEYTNPLEALKLYNTNIVIDKSYLITNRKNIIVSVGCLIDDKNHKLIQLTFTKPNNMNDEISALIGLKEYFHVTNPWPKQLKSICYWDVSNGISICTDYDSLTPISIDRILNTANSL